MQAFAAARPLRGVDAPLQRPAFILAKALSAGRRRKAASSKPLPCQIPHVGQWLAGAISIAQLQRLAKTPAVSRRLGNLKIAPVRASQSKMNLRGLIKYVLFRDTTMKGEFRIMRELVQRDWPRIFIDVGANNGFYGSNSFPFVARGWRSLLIEPHLRAFERLQKLHAGKKRTTCLNIACADAPGELPLYLSVNDDTSRATLRTDDTPIFQRVRSKDFKMVRVERLESVLQAHGIPEDFGILSIDAGGMDYEVLLGLNLRRWHPRLIVTEDYMPKMDKKANYLSENNYEQVDKCDANFFWLRKAT
jgi:FkbM family methyltransferase